MEEGEESGGGRGEWRRERIVEEGEASEGGEESEGGRGEWRREGSV